MTGTNITPTLAEVMRSAIEAKLVDLHTAIPARVTKFYPDKLMCDAQPVVMRKFSSGQVLPLPVITAIPIAYSRTKRGIHFFPLEVGDYVFLIFAERSLDKWLTGGGIVDPQDVRKFDLTDAVAIPAVYPSTEPTLVQNPANQEIIEGEMKISLNKSGKVAIGLKNNPQVEVITILSQTLEALSQAQTATGPLLNAAFFAQLKTLIDQIKEG